MLEQIANNKSPLFFFPPGYLLHTNKAWSGPFCVGTMRPEIEIISSFRNRDVRVLIPVLHKLRSFVTPHAFRLTIIPALRSCPKEHLVDLMRAIDADALKMCICQELYMELLRPVNYSGAECLGNNRLTTRLGTLLSGEERDIVTDAAHGALEEMQARRRARVVG